MTQEDVAKERRERIALACLQGFLAGPYLLLIPNTEGFSQEEIYRRMNLFKRLMGRFHENLNGFKSTDQ